MCFLNSESLFLDNFRKASFKKLPSNFLHTFNISNTLGWNLFAYGQLNFIRPSIGNPYASLYSCLKSQSQYLRSLMCFLNSESLFLVNFGKASLKKLPSNSLHTSNISNVFVWNLFACGQLNVSRLGLPQGNPYALLYYCLKSQSYSLQCPMCFLNSESLFLDNFGKMSLK